jgi:hypothetical protein
MILSPDHQKRFQSARERFLRPALCRFFENEFPKSFGPIIRDQLVTELIRLIDALFVPTESLVPGQALWCAIDKRTRADRPNRRTVPVVITLIDAHDCIKLSEGTPMTRIAEDSIARITKEAFAQGGLLSMRDIGLLTWRFGGTISQYRKRYEEREQVTLPHPGSLQDMGSCISHKMIIIKKSIVEKKDPRTVARETNHSLSAVERYLNDFRRVRLCYEKEQAVEFIAVTTGIAKFVVIQYIEIIKSLPQ